MATNKNVTSAAEFAEQLEAIKKKRGYLMPHHGLLALTAPELLAGYDACYSALTLKQRQLAPIEKEFIWLGILAAREEYLATQHVTKFLKAGGTAAEVIAAAQLAALARGASSLSFASQYWCDQVPEIDGSSFYLNTLLKLTDGTPVERPRLHLAMIAIHTSLRNWQELKWHIAWAYDESVSEEYIAEAMSYSMFTGSIPYFIEGCEVWRTMIASGDVQASEAFHLWATTDQSGPSTVK
ncbi:MAG: hypothetical protein HN793_12815 [Rhodospirillaceae bacterium]|jgi:alkylhydroperoxidase/carboxymuconolactone decarboxylase family protein YurZ|nr:hypothetical protein [Rhodospirillaceae bacterium]MBT5566633.1 hypothetical protein [Rhodospirillaceae bacterium]MBT6090723.1 hypothetical protein [Rhodospirillaceae bacterium]MBT7451707.1 hypothetical protein [Rhodospirillaceae bacterium]